MEKPERRKPKRESAHYDQLPQRSNYELLQIISFLEWEPRLASGHCYPMVWRRGQVAPQDLGVGA